MGKGLEAFIDPPPDEAAIRRQVRVQTRGYMALIATVSLAVGGLIGYNLAQGNGIRATQTMEPPPSWGTQFPTADASGTSPTGQILQIYISGAVATPQVITLPAGSLIADALSAVGGAVPGADLDTINLAAPLYDHQHIVVPTKATEDISPQKETSPTVATLIDINHATAAELESLPGIGTTKAQAVIRYRDTQGPFNEIEEIQNVEGIGAGLFQDIAPYITANP
jgi:competence protein ComEA